MATKTDDTNETLAESTAKRLLAALKSSLKDCKAEDLVNIEVDFKIKTTSGNEKTGRVITSNMVQPVQVASDEPNNHAVTTRDSSVSTFVKSSSWPSLQNAVCQPITRMDDINSNVPPCPQDTLAYNVTTVPCQPAEDQDALYISTGHSSLPNKADETIDINGPFCEGLSGCVDDYSDYCTNQFEEEGIQFLVPNYCKPQSPQSHWLEDSPLVMQDEHSPTITVSVPSSTTTSGSYVNCYSEVAAAPPSLMSVAAKEGETSA